MNATTKGEFEVVKYFIEECHTNINEVTAVIPPLITLYQMTCDTQPFTL